MGATATIIMLLRKYTQSVTYALAGVAIKVSALSFEPKILRPAAHQGILPPPRKKSLVVLSILRETITLTPITSKKYNPTTSQSVSLNAPPGCTGVAASTRRVLTAGRASPAGRTSCP